MYNDDGEKICGRYTIMYEGFIFEGDSDGFNAHDTDDWDFARACAQVYPDVVTVRDNYYDVTFAKGEWY